MPQIVDVSKRLGIWQPVKFFLVVGHRIAEKLQRLSLLSSFAAFLLPTLWIETEIDFQQLKQL